MSAISVQMNFEKLFSYHRNCTIKVTKVFRGRSGTAQLILNLGTRWRKVVNMVGVVTQSRSGRFGEGKTSSPYQHSIPGPSSP